ncbi:hypothetical protein B0H13DRAFT_2658634 [Mycena leptocephala]|nr:hypothetical protein B0H13DRAFT_2658634 [Mycena leptocephala]
MNEDDGDLRHVMRPPPPNSGRFIYPEAEKYDKSLVESWKNDMEGMLIFVSPARVQQQIPHAEVPGWALLREFDRTVKLLAHISQQLASGSNSTAFPISSPVAFTPSTTSLICNALWFMSLGLSLTCALIATLLEQWARESIHRADLRSAPLIRARIYSYLYYGMKKFNMHVVVTSFRSSYMHPSSSSSLVLSPSLSL